MDCELREAQPGIAVMTCRGRLSWEAREQIPARVADYLENARATRGIVADLGDVEFVSSAGLGALFQVAHQMRDQGGRLVLANVPPTIQRLLDTVGMARMTTVVDSLADAVAELNKPQSTAPAEDSSATPEGE